MQIEEFENKYSYPLRTSSPIIYKDILFYPCKFSQYEIFTYGCNCLLFNQLDYPDLQLASLPRLYFLTDILNHENDEPYMKQHLDLCFLHNCLSILLELVFRHKNFYFIRHKKYWKLRVYKIPEDVNNFVFEKDYDSFEYVDFNGKDFETIRAIILNQNGINYSDEFLHKDVRKYMEEQDKADDGFSPTIEDYMEVVMMQLGVYDEGVFENMSLRRFNRLLHKSLGRETYIMQKTADLSGFVKFKGKIKHWLEKEDPNARFKSMFQKAKIN